MVINEPPFCRKCAIQGHVARDCHKHCPYCHHLLRPGHNCPQSAGKPKCFECGLPGHKKRYCPDVVCSNCNQKGHMKQDCPQKQKARQSSSSTPIMQEVRQGSTSKPAMAVPLGLPTPEIKFPDLKDAMRKLTEFLLSGRSSEAGIIPKQYQAVVEAFGGQAGFIDMAYGLVDPWVKSLEGEIITVQRLHEAHQQQGGDAFAERTNGVRQSEKKVDRAFNGYPPGLTTGSHYFIIKDGGGERTANFIRLWSVPYLSERVEIALVVLNYVLEMTMCRAFGTLPPKTLEEAFGPGEYAGIGLNVVSPLFQGKELAPGQRAQFANLLLASPDPEIRTWPGIRRAQIEEKNTKVQKVFRQRDGRRITVDDCYAALSTAIREIRDLDGLRSLQPGGDPFEQRQLDQVIDVDSWFENTSARIQLETASSSSPELVRPVGTPNALVGIILDRTSPTNSYDDGRVHLPYGIRESGFTESNSLIWTFDLRKFAYIPHTFQIAPPRVADLGTIRDSTRELLVRSNLRIILLCSRNAEMVAFGKGNDEFTFSEISLRVHDVCFQAWLEAGNGKIRRMFIRSPAPVTSLWASNGSEAYRLSTLFLFVATLARISIFPSFYESALALALTVRKWDAENKGRIEKATPATLEPTLQAWLGNKGFRTPEHLERLEKAGGGSLRYGILILSHVVPQRKDGHGRKRIPRSKDQRRDVIEKVLLENVRSLFKELNKQGDSVELATKKITSNEEGTPKTKTTSTEEITSTEGTTSRDESPVRESPMVEGPIDVDAASTDSVLDAIETGAFPMEWIEEAEKKAVVDKKLWEDPSPQTRSPIFRKRLELAIGSHFKGCELTSGRYRIGIQHIPITFRADPGHKEGFWVKAELTPPGIRNPNVWATASTDDDPGARLAFRVSIRDSAGKETFSCYPTTETWKGCCGSNTIVDELGGDDLLAISKRARRFVYVDEKNDPKNIHPDLIPFRRGAYTDDEGRVISGRSRKRRGDESVTKDAV